jgi:hypothetical protein
VTAAVRRDARLLIGASVAVVVLAAVSTVAFAAATGQFDTRRPVRSTVCGAAPTLPGAVVDVSLSDMPNIMLSASGGVLPPGRRDRLAEVGQPLFEDAVHGR